MPFIQRNAEGFICGRFEQPQYADQEWLTPDDPALLNTVPRTEPARYDIGAFRMGMLGSQGYRRIAEIVQSHHLTTAVGAIVVSPINWGAVTLTWNEMIAGLDANVLLSPEEVGEWNQIAQFSGVAVAFQTHFNSNGLLEITAP